MKCREFEDRMHLLLDERRPLDGDAPLVAHATGCEPCRQLMAGQQAVLSGLRFGRAGRLSPEFARRVVAQAGEQPIEAAVVSDRESQRKWAVVVGLLGIAAAMLVAVSIAAFNSGGANLVESDPSGNSKPLVNKRRNPDRAVAASAPDSHTDKGQGIRPQRGTLSLFGQPPAAYRVAIADMASNLPDAVEKLDEVERYAPGIRPIRVSFSMLIDAMWRAIPGRAADAARDESAWQSAGRVSGLV